MPGHNHKGPSNGGPMTGRGLGRCRHRKLESLDQKEQMVRGRERGMHAGKNAGRGTGSYGAGRTWGQSAADGFRDDAPPVGPSSTLESNRLREQADAYREVLAKIEQRLREIEEEEKQRQKHDS